jgi:hypothetical protein
MEKDLTPRRKGAKEIFQFLGRRAGSASSTAGRRPTATGYCSSSFRDSLRVFATLWLIRVSSANLWLKKSAIRALLILFSPPDNSCLVEGCGAVTFSQLEAFADFHLSFPRFFVLASVLLNCVRKNA